MLARGPGDELLCRFDLLRAGRHRERPRPQPVAALAEAIVGCERKADLVGNLRILRIGHKGGGDRRIDPHAAFTGIEQRQILVETIRGGTGRAGIFHQIEIEGESVLPFRLIELRLPVLIEPAGAE